MNPDVVTVEELIPFAFSIENVPVISRVLKDDPVAIKRIVESVFNDSSIRPFDRLSKIKKIFKEEPYRLTKWQSDMNCRYIYAVMLLLENERSPGMDTTREMVCTTTMTIWINFSFFLLPQSPSEQHLCFKIVLTDASLCQRSNTCYRRSRDWKATCI